MKLWEKEFLDRFKESRIRRAKGLWAVDLSKEAGRRETYRERYSRSRYRIDHKERLSPQKDVKGPKDLVTMRIDSERLLKVSTTSTSRSLAMKRPRTRLRINNNPLRVQMNTRATISLSRTDHGRNKPLSIRLKKLMPTKCSNKINNHLSCT